MVFASRIAGATTNFRKDISEVGFQKYLNKTTPSVQKSLGSGGAAEFHKKSTFFPPIEIERSRWNKIFPYRLIIVKPNRLTGAYDPIDKSATGWSGNIGGNEDKTEYVLPITPQDLTVINPYAINVSATLRGIIEEHNGIKFKIIRASGTTGVWPARKDAQPISIPTIPGSFPGADSLNSLTAGTREALGGFIDAGKELFGFDKNAPSDKIPDSTGYELMLELEQFLEAYVEAKKDPANNGWRLAWENAKNNESFLVTPITLTNRKAASSPLESTYQFELKAWKRIFINGGIEEDDGIGALRGTKDGNFWQTTLDKLGQARRTISLSRNIIAAVRNDINGPIDLMRQIVMAVKDISGVVVSLVDLPGQVINDYKNFFAEAKQQLRSIFGAPGQSSDVSKAYNKLDKVLSEKKGIASQSGSNSIASGATAGITTSAEAIFSDPISNFDFFNEITIDAIPVSTEINEAIQDELDKATSLTNDDLREFRQEMLDIVSDLEDSFGAGSSTFARINGRPEPTSRARPMSIEEFEIIAAFHEFIQILDSMTSLGSFEEALANNDPIETDRLSFTSNLAVTNEIPFVDPISKILIPFPFGATLEQIAHTFLGDANRWNEISSLNNLRAPYIDEEGVTQLFLSNGSGRQLNISDGSDLWIGQRVELFSTKVPLFFRKIADVEEIGTGNWLVTVDGDADLDKMKTSETASMRGFQAGTVNSQDKIFLPSTLPPPANSDLKIATFQETDNELLALAKVDLLLTPSNDLALNNQGDARIANGLTNLVQAMKLKIITERGSLFDHPTFGLSIAAGVSAADINAGDIFRDTNSMVKNDSRFADIQKLTINLRGNSLFIDLAVNLANGSGILPLSFPLGVR